MQVNMISDYKVFWSVKKNLMGDSFSHNVINWWNLVVPGWTILNNRARNITHSVNAFICID